jgi:hypothetical protein
MTIGVGAADAICADAGVVEPAIISKATANAATAVRRPQNPESRAK